MTRHPHPAANARTGHAQLRSVGRQATIEELAVGALMYSSASDAAQVAEHVRPDVFTEPTRTVWEALKALAILGIPPSPELVTDELRRSGQWDRRTATFVTAATVSGACPPAARHYSAAAVANCLRQYAESAGATLIDAARTSTESLLRQIITELTTELAAITDELDLLRGGAQ